MSTCVILPVFYLIKLEGERETALFLEISLLILYVDKAFITIAVVLHIVHFMHRSLLRETSVVGEILVRTERIGLLESFSR